MKLVLGIALTIALSFLTNVVSGYFMPQAEKRRKLVLSIFGALTLATFIVALWPEPDASHGSHTIRSLALTVRLTCTVKPGEELPPSQVEFVPVGDAHAYLDGPAGRIRLQFESPVRFRTADPDKIIVTNRFVLPNGTELEGKSIDVLRNYRQLSVPVITVVYGRALETMKLLEISLLINGDDVMYSSWEYNVPFQRGPQFEIPFDSKKLRLPGE